MSNRSKYVLSEGAMTVFLGWWRRITYEKASGSARADRATVKRAATLTAVALTPAYQRLYAEMAEAHDGEPWRDYEQERIAAIIGLAAHVKSDNTLTLPQAMSKREEGSDRNPVSDLRFARLLDAPDIEALFSGVRRTLPLIGYAVNPASLANDIFGWNDTVKQRWAYAYVWPQKAA